MARSIYNLVILKLEFVNLHLYAWLLGCFESSPSNVSDGVVPEAVNEERKVHHDSGTLGHILHNIYSTLLWLGELTVTPED